MPTYQIAAPDGKTYQIAGPEGASQEEVIQAVLGQHPEAGVEKTIAGYAKETLKAIPRGLVGGLEQAAVGASALLPEDMEKPVAAKARELAERFSPKAAPGYGDTVPVKLGEAVGSMGSFLIPGGLPARAGMAAAMGAGEARQRAQQEGATPEQISTATAQGILPGLTDILPIERLLGGLGKRTIKGAVDRITSAVTTGGLEGAQEVAQNIAQNFIAQGYKPSQDLYEGAGEAGGYGFGAGALAQALFDLALPGRSRATKPQTPPQEAAQPAAQPTPQPGGQSPEAKEAEVAASVAPTGIAPLALAPPVEPSVAPVAPVVEPEPPVAPVAPVVEPVTPVAPVKPAVEAVTPDAKLQDEYKQNDERIVAEQASPKPNWFQINSLKTKNKKILKKLGEALTPDVAPAITPQKDLADKTAAKAAQKEIDDATLTRTGEVEPAGSGKRNVALVSKSSSGEQPSTEIVDATGVDNTEPATDELTGGEGEQPSALTVESFVADRVAGKPQTSPEEIQFYQNNAEAIEAALQKAAAPIEGRINKAKLKKKAPEITEAKVPLSQVPLTPQQQEVADELAAIKNAPEAVKKYVDHYKTIDKAIEAVGFDTGYKGLTQGDMGYLKPRVVEAQAFARWVKAKGKPKEKKALAKYQAAAEAFKIKAEDKKLVKSREQPQKLRRAGKQQMEEGAKKQLEESVEEISGDPVDTLELKSDEEIEKILKKAKTPKRVRQTNVEEPDLDRTSTVADRDRVIKEAEENEGDDTRYSRGKDAAPTGHTKEGITKALKNHFKEDSRFDALTTVVQSEADLPDEIRQSKDYRAGTRGVAYKNKVFLVADNVPQGKELGVFLHEAGAHIGFDNIMKPGDRQFLADQVRKWAKGKTDAVETKAAQAALAKGGKSNDEIIAYMTEELVNRGVKPTSFRPANTWLRRVVEAFKKVMTKLGLRQDIAPQELVDLAYGAAHIAMDTKVGQKLAEFKLKAPGKVVEGGARFSTGSPILDSAARRRTEALTRSNDVPLSQQLINTLRTPKLMARLATKFNVYIADNTGAVKEKLLDAGMTAPVLNLAFASKSADTSITSMLTGAIQLNPNTNAFQAVAGPSIKTVHEEVHKIAKKIGGDNKKESFELASRVLDLGSIVLRERSLPLAERNKFKFPPEDIRAGEEALRLYGTEIRAAMDAWTSYKNGLLDAGLKAGRFSAEDVAEWKAAPDYVPWFRVLDDARHGYELKSSAKQWFRGLQDSGKVRDLMGGNVEQRPIGEILNNMEQLAFWMSNATIKNHAGIGVMDGLLQLDARKVGSPNAFDVDKARVVKIYRDGVETFYELGNVLDAHAFLGVQEVTGPWINLFAKGGDLLRKGTTLQPGFVVSQLFQDAFRVTAYSGAKNPFKVGARTFAEFGKELKGDKLSDLFASYGIIGQPDYIFQGEQSRLRANLDVTRTGVRRIATSVFAALDKMASTSDAAQRRAIYKQTIEETKSAALPNGDEALALYKAIEIINFQTRGSSQGIAILRHIIPFTNAYIQGMSIALRSMAGRGITLQEKQFALRLFYATAVKIGALSMLYSWLVGDDEEYQQSPAYARISGFMFPGTRAMIKEFTGTDPGGNLRIPAPTDLVGLIFKAIPEMTVNYVAREGTKNEVDQTKFFKELSNAAINAVSPPGAVPQIVKPTLELWANKSFFTGNPIVGRGLEHRAKDQQFTSSTTEAAKVMSAYLPLAPVQVDYFMRGMFGIGGGTAMFAMSALIDSSTSGGERPATRLNEIPQVRTFLMGNAAAGLKEDYYDLRDRATEVVNTINILKTRDPERLRSYIEENKQLYALQRSGVLSKIEKGLGELRKYRDRVDTDKNMPAEEKRQILDEIEKREVALLAHVNPSALRRLSGL